MSHDVKHNELSLVKSVFYTSNLRIQHYPLDVLCASRLNINIEKVTLPGEDGKNKYDLTLHFINDVLPQVTCPNGIV